MRAALILIALLWPFSAQAFWISNNPNFKERTTKLHCSGPQHCKPVPGRVYFTPRGWKVRDMQGVMPENQTYPSIDRQPWPCMWEGNKRTMRGGKLACLFLPESGN